MVNDRVRPLLIMAGLMVSSFGLSGCIAVTCPDGEPLLDSAGQTVKANGYGEVRDLADQYCPKPATEQPLTALKPVPPGTLAPTNFVMPAMAIVPVVAAALLPKGGQDASNSTTGTN